MRAVRCVTHGDASSLEVHVLEDLRPPRPGHVNVRVAAASINFPDLLVVADRYQVRVPTPFTPGGEFAGTITAVGEGVTSWSPGDEVMGLTLVGAFADQIEVPKEGLSAVPAGLSMEEAAAFRATHLTAYHALVDFGELKRDDKVVVLGAAGGVGSAAVDLASRMGGRVTAVTRRGRGGLPSRLGASHHVHYDRDDLRDELRKVTGGGADVIIDPVGGPHTEPSIRAAAWGGRYVTVGYAAGGIPRLPLNLVLLKNIQVRGFTLGGLMEREPALVRDADAALAGLVLQGLRPAIWRVYELEDVRLAMQAVADREVEGKVVLRMDGGRS